MGARFEVTEEIVQRCLVKTVTASPLGASLERASHSQENPASTGPLLPQVVGHAWDSPQEGRINVHGMAGPGRWPLRAKDGSFEALEVYDRRGRPGHLCALQAREVWVCQGRTGSAWDELIRQGRTEKEVADQGNRATGIQVTSNLLVMAGALVEFLSLIHI